MIARLTVFAAVATFALTGPCAFAQSTTEQTTVTKTKPSVGAGVGIVGGAATGALVGGPIGAVVGGVVGGVAGIAVDPPKEVKTYVRTQHADSVRYEGSTNVGQVLPDTVNAYDVPQYQQYRWAYLNGQKVLIDRKSRRVVSVVVDDPAM
jgi:hypothetical protein